jgi:UDP-N-acetylmuramate dehydrogenase
MILDFKAKKWLTSLLGSNIKFNEPMSKHTSLRVGGPAEAFAVPENVETLKWLVTWAWQEHVPYLIIGDGSNLLVKDDGIHGIVIALTKCLKQIKQTDRTKRKSIIVAMTGIRLQTLCNYAINHGLSGLNFALGIPGTVGGAIMMNAGTLYGQIENVLQAVTILMPTGETQTIPKQKLKFSYRHLALNLRSKNNSAEPPVIINGSFALRPSDPQKLKTEAKKIIKWRKQKHPLSIPSAGCFFKNPATGKTAGELIDLAGLKGTSVGGAEVSCKHANFLVNTGQASASDFIALMELVRETVSRKFDTDLEGEVKIVGI